jgi:hypothetical protein
MRLATVPATAAALACGALLLAGCTAAGTSSSSPSLSGDSKAVAKVVTDIASAGRSKDAQKICTQLLAPSLADRFKTPGADCVSEVKKAIDDSDDFDLQVRSVRVTGDTAQAQVRQGSKGTIARFTFARQGGVWRATGLGG